MAWIDDRAWCHPKLVNLTAPAFRAYVNGLCYSSGLSTGGVLTPAQQVLLGATLRIRNELQEAGLWDPHDEPAGAVVVHDWDEHNSARDEQKRLTRERVRAHRARQRNAGNALRNANGNAPVTRYVTVHEEVKSETSPKSPSAVTSIRCEACGETYGAGHLEDCPRMARSA